MTFQTPLISGDYTKLRGSNANGGNRWAGRQFITLCRNTVVFQAEVTSNVLSSSFAQIPYTSVTVGAYTDIEIGETYFLSHTSDIRDYYYRGRIRGDATASDILVNETSVNVTAGDSIFVVYDFDLWDVLSRMVGTTQYWDWDIAFHTMQPAIVGLQTAYINYDPAGSTYRVAFDVSDSFATDANSTSSLTYQFTFVAGTYTVVSGSLATAIVTVDFNTDTENWGKLEVTDSQGVTKTRRFYVRNHGVADPPSLDFSGCQITGSLDSGWNATVSAWAGVDDVLDQTFCVVSNQEYYNGVLGPVSIANNIDMVGRFHRETNEGRGDPTYSYVASVRFEIEGICTQMQRLEEQDLTTIYSNAPTVIDEINNNTPQRSILYYFDEHSTATRLYDVTFPDGFDITYLYQYVTNQGGNVLDAVRGIAAQFNANVEFAPDGRIQVVRDTRFLTNKSGVPVIADWTTADFTTISLPVDPVSKTGRLDAYGATFNSGVTSPFRSRAPGSAQGYAAGQASLDNQILRATSDQTAARKELSFRAGQQMAIDNLTVSQDWKATTGGYHFLIPSRGQRVTHTLPTSTNVRGRAYTDTDYWQITQITINHNNIDGSREVTTHEELEPPQGDAGDNVPQIAGGTQTNPILLQPLDPFPALPDDPGNYLPDDPTPNPYPPNIPPKTGGAVIYTDGSIADTSRTVTTDRTPAWTGVTPIDLGDFAIKDVTFDRTSSAPPIGAYLLASDGTNSAIWYTSDAYAQPSPWSEGATFAGVYTSLRSASTPGGVLAYNPALNSSAVTLTPDAPSGAAPTTLSTLTMNVGDMVTATPHIDGSGLYNGGFTTSEAVTIQIVSQTGFTPGHSGGGPSGVSWQWHTSGPDFTGTPQPGDTSPATSTGFGGNSTTPYSIVIKLLATASSTAKIRYSSDYGATVGSAIAVGDSPGAFGVFDLIRIGSTSIAAAAGKVKLATTLGGAYSDAPGGTLAAGNPVALVIPVRRFPHGAIQDNTSTPDFIMGADTDNSGESLWTVTGAGTVTDITPVSGAVVQPHCLTAWQTASSLHIQVVILTSGVYKLYTYDGSSWTFRRNVTTPNFLRYKRLGNAVLYLIDGTTLYISFNHGATWVADTTPSSTAGIAMDIFY